MRVDIRRGSTTGREGSSNSASKCNVAHNLYLFVGQKLTESGTTVCPLSMFDGGDTALCHFSLHKCLFHTCFYAIMYSAVAFPLSSHSFSAESYFFIL